MMKMIKQAMQIIDSIKANIKIEDKYKNHLTQLIKDKYPQIQKSINEENYIIEYEEFDNFNEIIQDDKCVGFFTTQIKKDQKITLILNECYIITKYRGKKIIKNLIFTIKSYPDMEIILRNPTKNLMKSLEYSGLVLPLKNGIIHSTIKLIDTYENIQYNQIDTYEKKQEYITQLYDLNKSAMIRLKNNKINLSTPRKAEQKKYNLTNIEKLDKQYTNNIKLLIFEYKHHIDTLEFLFYYKQLDLLTVENIIGREDKLNDNIIKQLKKHDKTIQEGYKIREEIIKALEINEITQLTIYNRFMYLLEKDENIEKDNDNINSCPECRKPYTSQFKYCHNCGYNLYRQDLNEEVDKLLDDYYPLDIFDDKTRLELKFQRRIKKEGYNPTEVYDDQLEIATYQMLEYIDKQPDYIALAPFDMLNHIKPESITDILLEKKLIEKKNNPDYIDDFLQKQIKELPEVNHLDEYIYTITRKGRRYYKKNAAAAIFTHHLKGLEYYQFKRYLLNSDTYNVELLINEYTNRKLEEALKYEDTELYTKLMRLEALRLMDMDNELLATTIIKALICSLNKYALKENVTIKDEPIEIEIATLYIQFKELISQYNFNRLYNNAYDSITMKKLKFNKQQNKKIIKQMEDNHFLEVNRQIILDKIGVE